jgi:DNA-directed RNA polymerase subunit omega
MQPMGKDGGNMQLMSGFDSNYRFIIVAARRARQLQSGAPTLIDTSSRKPCRIAQDEIRAGKVHWELTAEEKHAVLADPVALDVTLPEN